MQNNNTTHLSNFEIHASIVFQLGEDLISDEVQALVELIKNSYDACSQYAKVEIETSDKNDFSNSKYPEAKGYIKIDDNGDGMDLKTIHLGWLTISNSLKRDMKKQRKSTRCGRTPLGDKGLGRLGVQRLGTNVEIFTKTINSDIEYHVSFSWRDFEKAELLSKVLVTIEEIPPTRVKGTTILISDIKNPNIWKNEKQRLEDELSQMISPYKQIKEFSIFGTIDGVAITLAEISDQVLRSSQLRYLIEFNGKKLQVEGKARFSFFSPQSTQDKEVFRSLVELDGGKKFFDFLLNRKEAKKYDLKKGKDGWFVEYSLERKFDNFDSLDLLDDNVPANPGPFKGQIDSFDVSTESAKQQSVFDSISEYRTYIKNLSGVRIYRDGFGIRVDRDWLGLGKQWTSATSWYVLRPDNTLGYIALTAKGNSVLEETTDREGFKVSPYYNNFMEIINNCIKFTRDVQGFLRRGWILYRNQNQEEVAKVESEATPESLSMKIKNSISKAGNYQSQIEEMKQTLISVTQTSQKTIQSIERNLFVNSKDYKEIKSASETLKKNIEAAQKFISQFDEYLQEISELDNIGQVLINQIQQLREQLDQVYETVSLGLTAEALSHEIQNITDRLARYIYDIRNYLKDNKIKDAKIIAFVEHCNSSVTALRKQMAHLAPSLKYIREKREDIELQLFFHQIRDDYENRSAKNNIKIQTDVLKDHFTINMNRGKFIQIIDNLILNSEYWLREDIRRGFIDQGIIKIEIRKPFIRIQDNGRGIDPSVESNLFEPFVTTKGKGNGRGLGLFIVRQLLDSEGCEIALLPERNTHNRLFTFEIDLSGVLHGER